MDKLQKIILDNYDNTDLEGAPENKIENYFSICHYILKSAQEEACRKDEILTFDKFFQWASGLPSIFDILYTFENSADVLIDVGIEINKTVYVMDQIKCVYDELLNAEEYYQFFKQYS